MHDGLLRDGSHSQALGWMIINKPVANTTNEVIVNTRLGELKIHCCLRPASPASVT
jgi:hypothetical protein